MQCNVEPDLTVKQLILLDQKLIFEFCKQKVNNIQRGNRMYEMIVCKAFFNAIF